MKLIALCGAAGAGKDTVADMLPMRKLAFADALYREAAEAFDVAVARLKDRIRKEEPFDNLAITDCESEEFSGYLRWSGKIFEVADYTQPRSPRQIMQWWGDYRRALDPEYFVKAMRASCTPGIDTVITDVRFANEAAMVRQLGGQIWQVVRPGVTAGATGHASDNDGSQFSPDRVILNDGTLEDLRAKLEGL